MEQQELDRKDLKILALKQRLAEIVVDYEDKDADRRVEITEQQSIISNLREVNESISVELNELRESNVEEEITEDCPE